MSMRVFIRKSGVIMVVPYLFMATAVVHAADDPEDRASYCARTAGEHCFSTQGYTSQECEDRYFVICLDGAGGGSDSTPPPWFDPGVPVRDGTYGGCLPRGG